MIASKYAMIRQSMLAKVSIYQILKLYDKLTLQAFRVTLVNHKIKREVNAMRTS